MGNNQSYVYSNISPQPISAQTVQEKSNLLQIDMRHLTETNYFLKRIVKGIYQQYPNCTINAIRRVLYIQNFTDEHYYILVNISFPNNRNLNLYFSEILQISYDQPSITNDNLKSSEIGVELLYKNK